jgi:hypothetical protein
MLQKAAIGINRADQLSSRFLNKEERELEPLQQLQEANHKGTISQI